MEDNKKTDIEIKNLSSDSNYYNNVFKKTEKILSVTLYIVSELHQNKKTEQLLPTIKDTVLTVHQSALATLRLQPHEQKTGLLSFQYELLALESLLRMTEQTGLLPSDITHLILSETDAVHRVIKNNYQVKSPISLSNLTETVVKRESGSTTRTPAQRTRRASRVQIPAGDISSDAYLVYSQLTDRAERIKTVLEAKPQATVKDIAEIITDVSEKTIQRELNSLIEKGQVLREGERRWSKYSVVKS